MTFIGGGGGGKPPEAPFGFGMNLIWYFNQENRFGVN